MKSWSVAGIDPSNKAIASIKEAGFEGYVGTADALPIADKSIDLLIFGFCLYLCDRDDLSLLRRIPSIKTSSWLAIYDFWSPNLLKNVYHHHSGVRSYKDDLSTMFKWHPSYTIMIIIKTSCYR